MHEINRYAVAVNSQTPTMENETSDLMFPQTQSTLRLES
jgi:hypothetical protein